MHEELLALAMKALERVYCAGFSIRKAGVMLAALDPAESLTRRLWDDPNYEHRRQLMAAMDRINGRFGHGSVRCGVYPAMARGARGRKCCRPTTQRGGKTFAGLLLDGESRPKS